MKILHLRYPQTLGFWCLRVWINGYNFNFSHRAQLGMDARGGLVQSRRPASPPPSAPACFLAMELWRLGANRSSAGWPLHAPPPRRRTVCASVAAVPTMLPLLVEPLLLRPRSPSTTPPLSRWVYFRGELYNLSFWNGTVVRYPLFTLLEKWFDFSKWE